MSAPGGAGLRPAPVAGKRRGWGSGFVGMLMFSGSLPATRVAVGDFPPLFLTSARAVVAAVLAGAVLALLRPSRPGRGDLLPLVVTASCVVLAFPLLTALALRHVTAAHSVVYIGLLPLATAVFGVVRGGERPRPAFWIFSCLGSLGVATFSLVNGTGGSVPGDLLMCGAILCSGLGYAEGAILSARLGGWQVICWALLLALPPMALLSLLTMPTSWPEAGAPAWLGLAYVSVFSMLVGFFFWFRGLALGGTAGVGQLQLLQPFFGLAFAAAVLHETVAWTMVATASLVGLCVAGARRFSRAPRDGVSRPTARGRR